MTTDGAPERAPIQSRRPFLIPGIVLALLALIGVATLPEGYYQFLRAAVCDGALLLAAIGVAARRSWWVAPAIAAVLVYAPVGRQFFNPGQAGWAVTDAVAGLLFLIAGFSLPTMRQVKNGDGRPSTFQSWWFYAIICTLIILICVGVASAPTIPES